MNPPRLSRKDLYLLELIAWAIDDAKDQTMAAIQDLLDQVTAERTELQADADAILGRLGDEAAQITALQQQVADLTAAGAGATPEQVAQLQEAADGLAAIHTELVGALPPAGELPPAAPTS